MNERRPNLHEDEDGLIVIGEHEEPKTFMGRILHWFGEATLWLFACIPPLLIILYGANGVRNERLVGLRWAKRVSYGDNAVGWGWIFIGIGFWALGQGCYLKTGRPVLKLIGWILAVSAFGIGVWMLLRRFVQHPA